MNASPSIKKGRSLTEDLITHTRRSWLANAQSLSNLRRKKRLRPIPRYFQARTPEALYVADNNLITVWSIRTGNRFARSGMATWNSTTCLQQNSSLEFSYDLFVPNEAAVFHQNIETLVSLSNQVGLFYFDLAHHLLKGCSEDEMYLLKSGLLGEKIDEMYGRTFDQRMDNTKENTNGKIF